MVFALAACSGGTPAATPAPSAAPAASTAPEASKAPEAPEATGAEIAMITDKGDINDKSFNQGTWEGVQAYADANGKTCQYYKPVEATTDAYIAMIEQSIQNGAKVVVTPGYLFEIPIYTVQDQYPDVKFILIDGTPNDGNWAAGTPAYKTADNTVGILFAEEQVGYMAGYAAVKDGYTKLGFLGGQAVPAVVRYGYGFVQGANDAAKEANITIDMKYFYTSSFDATPEAQAMAAGWYTNGTEVIFACGGSVGNSAMAAAEANNGKVIGVDVDQAGESTTVISSAMKGLKESVNQMLASYYDGSFPGGQNLTLGAADAALGLPMDTSKWNTFSTDDYDALFTKLASGSITLQKDSDAVDPTALTAASENVKVDLVAS